MTIDAKTRSTLNGGYTFRLDAAPSQHAAAIATLRAERATLITYMRQRMDREDWHGVMDASADVREIDAKLGVLEAQ